MLVEDNDDLREALHSYLEDQGFSVASVDSAESINEFKGNPDAYIIDINLPGASGFDLIKRIRLVDQKVPIIAATARSQASDMITGYELGADIYLAKPITPGALNAAINSLLRRQAPETSQAFDGVFLDSQRSVLIGPDRSIPLTPGETQLLRALAIAPQGMLEYWEVAEILGMQLDEGLKPALEVRIVRLRKKFDSSGLTGPAIKAMRSIGYSLACQIKFK